MITKHGRYRMRGSGVEVTEFAVGPNSACYLDPREDCVGWVTVKLDGRFNPDGNDTEWDLIPLFGALVPGARYCIRGTEEEVSVAMGPDKAVYYHPQKGWLEVGVTGFLNESGIPSAYDLVPAKAVLAADPIITIGTGKAVGSGALITPGSKWYMRGDHEKRPVDLSIEGNVVRYIDHSVMRRVSLHGAYDLTEPSDWDLLPCPEVEEKKPELKLWPFIYEDHPQLWGARVKHRKEPHVMDLWTFNGMAAGGVLYGVLFSDYVFYEDCDYLGDDGVRYILKAGDPAGKPVST